MRVLQLLLSPRIGGAETLASSLQKEWASNGTGSVIHYLDPELPRGKLAMTRLQRVHNIRRILRSEEFDVVLSHSALPSAYARVAASRHPVVTVLHSASDDYLDARLRISERILRSRTAHVVAVSQSQAALYRRHFPSIDLTVIPNGIPADLPLRTNYSPQPRHILTVARVTEQKNPELWLSVARNAIKKQKDLHFTWYGPIDDSPAIRRLVDSTASEPNVCFAGPTDEIQDILQSVDILFHPSDREANSLALLEAGAAGTPVLCAEGIDSNWEGGLPVQTFQAGNPDDALRALTEMVMKYSQAAEHAKSVAPQVRANYSISKCAASYHDLLSTKTRSRP